MNFIRNDIIEEPEAPQHDYKEGTWSFDDSIRSWRRNDICNRCGCVRVMIKSNKTETPFPATHERSKQIFGHGHEPACWGDKNP